MTKGPGGPLERKRKHSPESLPSEIFSLMYYEYMNARFVKMFELSTQRAFKKALDALNIDINQGFKFRTDSDSFYFGGEMGGITRVDTLGRVISISDYDKDRNRHMTNTIYSKDKHVEIRNHPAGRLFT